MLTETVSERVATDCPRSCDELANAIKVSAKKIDDYQNTTGKLLIEAKRRCREFKLTFSAFCGKCGLEKSRAYELIAKFEGRTNEDEVRAERRERNARHTAKNKAARDSVLDGKSASSDPFAEQRDAVMAAMDGAGLADWGRLLVLAMAMKEDRAEESKSAAANDNVAVKPKPAPKKLTARQKRNVDDKTYTDHGKRFGFVTDTFITPDIIKRMEASLKSGVDELAELKAEQADYVREETARRAALNEPLLAPITREKEEALSIIIKTRTLWEGACGLSWQEYFEYRESHCSVQLTRSDLAYAAQYTACAIVPEMDESEVTEKSLRWRAKRIGYKISRRGAEYKLTDGDGTGPGGSIEGLIDWLDLITPTMGEQEAIAA
jgi:hypothetical protein